MIISQYMSLVLTTSLSESELGAVQLLMLKLGSTTESSLEKLTLLTVLMSNRLSKFSLSILISKYAKQFNSNSATEQLKKKRDEKTHPNKLILI